MFLSQVLPAWLRLLTELQYHHRQIRALDYHVEHESSEEWYV